MLYTNAPGREPLDVRAHVRPALAVVACEAHDAVVRPGPDDARLDRRFLDVDERRGNVLRLGPQSGRHHLLAAVVGREVGADGRPRRAPVGRLVHVLAAGIGLQGIVWRHGEWNRPVEAVRTIALRAAPLPRRPGARAHRPARAHVDLLHARGARRPHDLRIGKTRHRPSALGADGPDPEVRRNQTRPAAGVVYARALQQGAAGSSVRGAILPARVDVVGDAAIDRDAVRLCVRERRAKPRPPARPGDVHVAIVGDDDAVLVLRVEPDVVRVGKDLGHRLRGGAPVTRSIRVLREEIHLVGVSRVDAESPEVAGPPVDDRVAARHRPARAAIVGSPEIALIGCFDERVDAPGVAGGDDDADAAQRRVGQALSGEPCPRGAAVARHVKAAARAAVLAVPGMNRELPGRGKHRIGARGIDDDVDGARLLVDEQDPLPGASAVTRPEDAALRLGPVAVTHGRDVDDRCITRVDGQTADAAGLVEPHVRPGLASVGRFVDAVANLDVRPDVRVTRAGPHDVCIRWCDRERADGRGGLVVEDRVPVQSAVGGLEDTARGRAGEDRVRVARHTGHRVDAVPRRPDVSERHGRKERGQSWLRADDRGRYEREERGEREAHQEADRAGRHGVLSITARARRAS